MSSRRTTCKTKNCRKWKNLSDNGYCPVHFVTNSAEAQIQEVCKCINCISIVNDTDHAVNCELCDEWSHVQCTDITQELYEQLDPSEGESPSGIKWFCVNCLPKFNSLLANFKTKQSFGTQTDAKGTQFDSVKVPICEEYRYGSCPHGLSGKRAVGGKCCEFRHPKRCLNFCKYGNNPDMGCTNPECRYLHPILCRNSVRHHCCENEKCTFTHLKGTLRSRTYNVRNKSNYNNRDYPRNPRQQYASSRRAYSHFDSQNLGFHSYSTQRANANYKNVSKNNQAAFSNTSNNQGHLYQPQEFPILATQNTCNEQDNHTTQPNEVSSPSGPSFF